MCSSKGAIPNLLPVTFGVPQSSIFDPFLFPWYINRLPDKLSKETLIYLFADRDAKLARIILSPLDVTEF